MGSLLSKIGSVAKKVLDTASVALAHPIKTAQAIISPTKKVEDVTKEFFEKSTTKRVTEIVTGTTAIASTIAGTAAVSAATKAGTLGKTIATTASKVVKSAISHPVKAAGVTAVSAVAIPAVISSEKVREKITEAPSELAQFGRDLGKFIDKPSLESAKELVKESPLITSGIVAGTAILGAKEILPAVSTFRQTEAIKEQTEAIKGLTTNVLLNEKKQEVEIPLEPTIIETNKKTTKEDNILPQPTPITPETKPLIASAGSSSSIKRKKRVKKVITQPIKQNMNVIIQNKTTGIENFIKKRAIIK